MKAAIGVLRPARLQRQAEMIVGHVVAVPTSQQEVKGMAGELSAANVKKYVYFFIVECSISIYRLTDYCR